MFSSRARLLGTLPVALAVCPMLSGPRTSVVYAECGERQSQKQRDAARGKPDTDSPASEKDSPKKPAPGGACLSACVAKPADTEASRTQLLPSPQLDDDGAMRRIGTVQLTDQVDSCFQIRPPVFRAQAPPIH